MSAKTTLHSQVRTAVVAGMEDVVLPVARHRLQERTARLLGPQGILAAFSDTLQPAARSGIQRGSLHPYNTDSAATPTATAVGHSSSLNVRIRRSANQGGERDQKDDGGQRTVASHMGILADNFLMSNDFWALQPPGFP